MSVVAASNSEFPNEDVHLKIGNVLENENNTLDALKPMLPLYGSKRKKRFSSYRPYASPTNRLIMKCGKYNVFTTQIPQRMSRYIRDLGNTLVSIRWRWILISICIANMVAYLMFTVLWMLMVAWEESYMTEKNREPCIIGTSSFAGYFILVVETMTTIGSGTITPTDCQTGWVMMTLQSLATVAIEGALVAAIFVKMSRPNNKNCTQHFSKKAIICRRDGYNCLIFRVKDIYGKYWAKTSIKAVLIRRKNSVEGDSFPQFLENLKLQETGLLIWPQEVVHVIDETSPFWSMSKRDLYTLRFEIMVVLGGDSLITGHLSQSQTSYTNKEILWGYRFLPCVEFDEAQQRYIVNEAMFNDVVRHEIPDYSASELKLVFGENGIKPKQG